MTQTPTQTSARELIEMVQERANCNASMATAYITGFVAGLLTEEQIADLVEMADTLRV